MQSTGCSPGFSRVVAMEGTISEGRQQARTNHVTIWQIFSVPNRLFPLLLECNYLQKFSDGFGRRVCCRLCLERDSGGNGHGELVRVWEGEELVRLYKLFYAMFLNHELELIKSLRGLCVTVLFSYYW